MERGVRGGGRGGTFMERGGRGGARRGTFIERGGRGGARGGTFMREGWERRSKAWDLHREGWERRSKGWDLHERGEVDTEGLPIILYMYACTLFLLYKSHWDVVSILIVLWPKAIHCIQHSPSFQPLCCSLSMHSALVCTPPHCKTDVCTYVRMYVCIWCDPSCVGPVLGLLPCACPPLLRMYVDGMTSPAA